MRSGHDHIIPYLSRSYLILDYRLTARPLASDLPASLFVSVGVFAALDNCADSVLYPLDSSQLIRLSFSAAKMSTGPLGLPPVSPELKSISPFLQRADELRTKDPVMAYWCKSLVP